MKMLVKLAMAAGVMLAASLLAAPSYGVQRTPKPGTAAKAETYVVIKVGDEVLVVPKSKLVEEKKRVAEEYKNEMKAYEDARKAAIKAKEKPELTRPVKLTVRSLKGNLKTEQEANDWKDKYLEKEGAPKTNK